MSLLGDNDPDSSLDIAAGLTAVSLARSEAVTPRVRRLEIRNWSKDAIFTSR